MSFDLTTLSRLELLELQSNVAKALEQAEVREREEARKAAEAAVAEFGFSLNDVLDESKAGRGRKGNGTVSAPKYRNPADPSQTWTGKGRKPGWLNEALENGVSIDELEI